MKATLPASTKYLYPYKHEKMKLDTLSKTKAHEVNFGTILACYYRD